MGTDIAPDQWGGADSPSDVAGKALHLRNSSELYVHQVPKYYDLG